MDCPLCFSTAGPGFSLTLEEVEAMLDDFVRTEGAPEVVQFSAASRPSIHKSSIRQGRKGPRHSLRHDQHEREADRQRRQVRLSSSPRCEPSFYFQFDGFDRRPSLSSRRAGHLEEKVRALDRLAAAGLNVTLVPAIERGVNEHEIGRIVDFAIDASGGSRESTSSRHSMPGRHMPPRPDAADHDP